MPNRPVRRMHTVPAVQRQAALAALATFLVIGVGWLVALMSGTEHAGSLVRWGGAVAVLAFSGAVGACFHFAGAARSWREQALGRDTTTATWEKSIADVARETLPALAASLRDGGSLDDTLAKLEPPRSVALQGLVRTFGTRLADAEGRGRSASLRYAGVADELGRATAEILPAAVKRIRDKVSAETVLAELSPSGADPSAAIQDSAVRDLLRAAVTELGESERRGSVATAASANAAARVQAQSTTLLARLRELQFEYGDNENVFGHLLELDHQVSQLGRLADSIALLSGGRSGRRWTKPIAMESVLRGAMGRIEAYRRVQLNLASSAAIVGYAAEGVMHLLAELLDNATAFSPRYTKVHVYAEEVDAGVIVTIEDSGVSMRQRELSRAQTLVAARTELTSLAGTRLGLAVVGRLAGKHGLSVSFRPSSRGGTGVVVLIPRRLVTLVQQPVQQSAPQPAQPYDALAEEPAPAPGGGDPDLPKRRPGKALGDAGQPAAAEAQAPPAKDVGARFAAFRAQTAPSPQPPAES